MAITAGQAERMGWETVAGALAADVGMVLSPDNAGLAAGLALVLSAFEPTFNVVLTLVDPTDGGVTAIQRDVAERTRALWQGRLWRVTVERLDGPGWGEGLHAEPAKALLLAMYNLVQDRPETGGEWR